MEFFNCTFCKTQFDTEIKKPYLLKCGHSICQICISSNNFTSCNQCNEQITVTSYEQLKQNFSMINLLQNKESLQVQFEKFPIQKKIYCSKHKRDLEFYCKYCKTFLCSTCIMIHLDHKDSLIDTNIEEIDECFSQLNLFIDKYINFIDDQILKVEKIKQQKVKTSDDLNLLKSDQIQLTKQSLKQIQFQTDNPLMNQVLNSLLQTQIQFIEFNNTGLIVTESNDGIEIERKDIQDQFALGISKESFTNGKYSVTVKFINCTEWLAVGVIGDKKQYTNITDMRYDPSFYGWGKMVSQVWSGGSFIEKGTDDYNGLNLCTGAEIDLILDIQNKQVEMKIHKLNLTHKIKFKENGYNGPWKFAIILYYKKAKVQVRNFEKYF